VTRAFLAPLLSLWLTLPAWAGTVLVDMLDVGQGDAILVRTAEKTVLIDAGTAKSHVLAQLKALGVESVDLMISSHPHADHIGGMVEVLNGMPVKLFMDNGMTHTTKTYQNTMAAVEERGIAYRTATPGSTLKLNDEAWFEVLFPTDSLLKGTRSDLNSNSLVLLLVHKDMDFLLTGDAEEPTEEALLAAGLGQVDVLKVAHHGSAHSTSRHFLDATRPSIAVISCGADNRYGHPAPDTVARLKRAQAMVYRTDLSGHLRLISNGTEIEVLEGSLAEIAGLSVVNQAPSREVSKPTSGLSTKKNGRRK